MPTTACPQCNQRYSFRLDQAHTVFECKKCGQQFTPMGGPVTAGPGPQSNPQPDQFDFSGGGATSAGQAEVVIQDRPACPPPGAVLGAASIMAGVVAGLFIPLPFFWFLALPLSGLGAMLAMAGLKCGRGDLYSLAGLLVSAGVFIGSTALLVRAQAHLNDALEKLRQIAGP